MTILHLTYFQNGQGDGVFVPICAGIGMIFGLLRNFKGTLGAGIASVALLVFTFIRIQMKMAAMQADTQQKLAGNPFRGLAEATMGSLQFERGWLVGGGLMIAAGLVGSVVGRRNCPHCAGQILVAASMCRFCARAVVPVGVTTVETHEDPLLKPIHVSDRVRKWIGITCYLPGIVAVGLVVFISFFSTPTERWGHMRRPVPSRTPWGHHYSSVQSLI